MGVCAFVALLPFIVLLFLLHYSLRATLCQNTHREEKERKSSFIWVFHLKNRSAWMAHRGEVKRNGKWSKQCYAIYSIHHNLLRCKTIAQSKNGTPIHTHTRTHTLKRGSERERERKKVEWNAFIMSFNLIKNLHRLSLFKSLCVYSLIHTTTSMLRGVHSMWVAATCTHTIAAKMPRHCAIRTIYNSELHLFFVYFFIIIRL